jgi:hypothetical protein
MKKICLPAILILLIVSNKMFAQGMMTPDPIKSPLLESMMGTWVSNPYEMMGEKMTDEVTQSMIMNGQFMQINVKSTGSSGFVYEALIIIAPSKDGSFAGWSYDIFGKNAMTTYTGSSKDNQLFMTGTGNMGTEIRNITMEGNIMIANVSFKMKDESGKEMPEMTMAITYNKK